MEVTVTSEIISHLTGFNWKYNSRYWTDGLRVNETNFKWCSIENEFPKTMWLKGQPNNVNKTENCAQMLIVKEKSSVVLEDRMCSVVSALACQVPLLHLKKNCKM